MGQRAWMADHAWMAWSAGIAASVVVGIGVAVARAERARARRRGWDAIREELVPDEGSRGNRIPQRERRFGLFAQEGAGEGLRRIALAQLDLAMELLRGEADVPAEEMVHEARKAFKRLRALVVLLGEELGEGRVRREREVLRACAGRLAGARDAEVMVEAYDALIARAPKLGCRRGAVELREHLERERGAAAEQALGNAAVRMQVAVELGEMRGRVQGWELGEGSAEELTGGGLRRIYRSGRAARRHARADAGDPLALHRWRKHAKELRYALEVLDVREAPGGGGAGSKGQGAPAGRAVGASGGEAAAGGRMAKLAGRADALGEVLGEEHDLMLLGELVRGHRPLKRHGGTRRRLLRAIARRRERLRRRAMRQGRRLYARRPGRFVRWACA